MGYAIIGKRFRWPGAVIPYTFNEDDFPDVDERAAIEAAVRAYDGTAITFRRAVPGDIGADKKVVQIVPGDGTTTCSSPVGRQETSLLRPVQPVRCDPGAASGTLIHELGHAVGLFHEHQRPDRQQFVDILMDNVIDDKRHNFEMRTAVGQEIGAYDLGSIMHYSSRDFAIQWTYGTRVFGGQRSAATPALAVFNNEIHMVHNGWDNPDDLFHARWTPGRGWSDDTRINLGQKSFTTPALAVLGDELHMVHLGSTGERTLWHSRWVPPDLGNWERNKPIAGRQTSTAPALAAFDGRLHMVALGTTGSRSLWHSTWSPSRDLGDWEEDKKIEDQDSSMTPALAVFENELHMVALGASRPDTLRHCRWEPPRLENWTTDRLIHSNARHAAPALCTSRGTLHLAYSAADDDDICHSRFNGDAWSSRNRADNNHPSTGPALADLDGQLFSVFPGSGGRLWYSTRVVGRVTIEPHPGVSITKGDTLSPGDIAAIAAMYA